MENDYLWDKTGEDKDVERLEEALKTFRYQPTTAPVLPVKILQIEENPKFSFFNLRFALAGFACLAIVFVGLGIWSQFSNAEIAVVEDVSNPIVAPIQIEDEPIFAPIIETPTQKTPSTPKIVRVVETKSVQPKIVAVSKPTRIVFQSSAPRVKSEKPIIRLTPEEKYAYDQLMLALSITSEKLKEVKDKANNIEETTPTIKALK